MRNFPQSSAEGNDVDTLGGPARGGRGRRFFWFLHLFFSSKIKKLNGAKNSAFLIF